MVSFSAWIRAFRLRTLPLALGCVILGTFVPVPGKEVNLTVFCLTLLTAMLLQILSNLANDYGDFKKGTDNANRLGPARMMQSGIIGEKEMRVALALLVILCLVSGLYLLYIVFGKNDLPRMLIMLLLGLSAIWAAMRYTLGTKPYGYAGLGDIAVMFFFGIMGVGGTYFLQNGEVTLLSLYIALSYGFLSAGVLNINNLRDIKNDKASGKITLAARLGNRQAVMYQVALVVFALLFQMLYFENDGIDPTGALALVGIVPVIINTRQVVVKRNDPARLNSLLKGLSLSILFDVLFIVVVLNVIS